MRDRHAHNRSERRHEIDLMYRSQRQKRVATRAPMRGSAVDAAAVAADFVRLREAAESGRLAILRKAEEILLKEGCVLPNYYYTRTRLVHPSVEGWQVRLLDDRMWKYFDLRYPPPACSMDSELHHN